MKKIIIALLIIFSFANCTSIPEPSASSNTLTVGKFTANINTTGRMMVGGNRNIKYGIEIYFKDNQTGREFSIATRSDGWFISNKLIGGRNYTIQKFFIDIIDVNGKFQFTLIGPFNLLVVDGVVNNIGIIDLDIEDNVYGYRVGKFDVLNYEFENKYPDSEWNSHQWHSSYFFER
jgi:hypothetical protein